MTTPIRDRFFTDHRRLEVLLERLRAAAAVSDRQEISRFWAEFDSGLRAHLEAEEKDLIPALSRVCERDARVLIQEHQHIRMRLSELGTTVDLDLVRLDSVRDFIDELKAHTRSEDRLLYQWADAHLDEPIALIDALAKKP